MSDDKDQAALEAEDMVWSWRGEGSDDTSFWDKKARSFI